MGFGIISALSGAKAREMELEVLANNIANIQTTGYKEMNVSFASELHKHSSENEDLAQAQAPLREGQTYVNFKQGAVFQTGNPTDVALNGDGFFTVDTPDGLRYTRDGNFHLDDKGTLITSQGNPVLGANGPIVVPQGKVLQIGPDGEVTANEEVIGKFRIADFRDRHQLKPEGHNYYSVAEGAPQNEQFTVKVIQGHLENSNVDLVSNMTRVIQVSRAYESLQKTLKQEIQATKMLNQLAKIS